MRKFFLRLTLALTTLCLPLVGEQPELFINNRVLARVKDKTFSLIDVVKQMDMYAFENDPSIATSTEKQYQFYMQSWRYFLDQLINNELMVFEADGKEIKISDGDVREEILARFGPNVQENLHKLNLSLDEAKELIYTDLLSQKIQGYYVHAKAFHSVTPERIREAYQAYLAKHPPHVHWKYKFMTVRANDETLGKAVAERAHTLIHDKHLSLREVVEAIQAENEGVKISLSRDVEGADADISEQHKSILRTLSVDAVSEPLEQNSRSSSEKVFRLFQLKEKEDVQPRALEDMHAELRDSLIRQLVSTGLEEYILKLRNKYDISPEHNTLLVPENYIPFELK